ncbi:MAG: hypothetical protein GY861_14860 [bacterium]|nr:hypothetical protein [bacterium]
MTYMGASEGFSSEELKRMHEASGFYKLQYHEVRSLNEIKSSLDHMAYTNPKIIKEHLAYLESLSGKINSILVREEREGIMNWGLRHRSDELRQLMSKLTGVLNTLATVS